MRERCATSDINQPKLVRRAVADRRSDQSNAAVVAQRKQLTVSSEHSHPRRGIEDDHVATLATGTRTTHEEPVSRPCEHDEPVRAATPRNGHIAFGASDGYHAAVPKGIGLGRHVDVREPTGSVHRDRVRVCDLELVRFACQIGEAYLGTPVSPERVVEHGAARHRDRERSRIRREELSSPAGTDRGTDHEAALPAGLDETGLAAQEQGTWRSEPSDRRGRAALRTVDGDTRIFASAARGSCQRESERCDKRPVLEHPPPWSHRGETNRNLAPARIIRCDSPHVNRSRRRLLGVTARRRFRPPRRPAFPRRRRAPPRRGRRSCAGRPRRRR
ncbi:MAG: hypothetical protein KatS3mg009_0246 [Acidimicrobiia bacterium]|nr:MAG: hypothetical protein KatS3mg009_0246 [Acidimicrobiia bacterium]